MTLTSELLSTFAIALFNFAEITELLFIELSKIGRRYLHVLEIYSCEHIGGCNIGFLIG